MSETNNPAPQVNDMHRALARSIEIWTMYDGVHPDFIANQLAQFEELIATKIQSEDKKEIKKLEYDIQDILNGKVPGYGNSEIINKLRCAYTDRTAERNQYRVEKEKLEKEIKEARRAWLGDDYGHLPLVEAMEKFRTELWSDACAAKEELRRRENELCQKANNAERLADALRNVLSMMKEWHRDFPDCVGDKEVPAIAEAEAALADQPTKIEIPTKEDIKELLEVGNSLYNADSGEIQSAMAQWEELKEKIATKYGFNNE